MDNGGDSALPLSRLTRHARARSLLSGRVFSAGKPAGLTRFAVMAAHFNSISIQPGSSTLIKVPLRAAAMPDFTANSNRIDERVTMKIVTFTTVFHLST